MNISTQIKIKSDSNLQKYIRTHSYWYKILNRNPNMLTNMIEEMKKEYKLTLEDKINNISEKMTLVQAFLNMVE